MMLGDYLIISQILSLLTFDFDSVYKTVCKKTLYGYALQGQPIGDILQRSPRETSGITFESS